MPWCFLHTPYTPKTLPPTRWLVSSIFHQSSRNTSLQSAKCNGIRVHDLRKTRQIAWIHPSHIRIILLKTPVSYAFPPSKRHGYGFDFGIKPRVHRSSFFSLPFALMTALDCKIPWANTYTEVRLEIMVYSGGEREYAERLYTKTYIQMVRI